MKEGNVSFFFFNLNKYLTLNFLKNKVYYLTEEAKHEMYRLYKENPKFWNVNRLGSKFGVDPERAAALIRFFFFLNELE